MTQIKGDRLSSSLNADGRARQMLLKWHGFNTTEGNMILTTIADTTNFVTFEFSLTGVPLATAPAVNDAGQIAFWGVTSSLEAGIFLGDGNSLRTIADTSSGFSFLGVGPSINERGTVAFLAGLDSGDAGYFTSNGATTTLIADSSGQFNFQRIPTLDNLFGEPVIND